MPERHSSYTSYLLRALQRVAPLAYARRRFSCRCCVPAEILAAYLTPGEEALLHGVGSIPTLSWMTGEEDMHW
ncbi:MAG: hypothetical protein HYZ72_00075 [Deltaproteobacteria bacterium]|nr:hypothetical protein [Deltaproteobacteria bacterium]